MNHSPLAGHQQAAYGPSPPTAAGEWCGPSQRIRHPSMPTPSCSASTTAPARSKRSGRRASPLGSRLSRHTCICCNGKGWSWDTAVGPDAPLPQHLSEWVDESGCHPTLAAASLQSLSNREVLEALAGDRLEQLGGWARQYATGAVTSRQRPPRSRRRHWWLVVLRPGSGRRLGADGLGVLPP